MAKIDKMFLEVIDYNLNLLNGMAPKHQLILIGAIHLRSWFCKILIFIVHALRDVRLTGNTAWLGFKPPQGYPLLLCISLKELIMVLTRLLLPLIFSVRVALY